jgi:hypothetical protein
VVRGDGSTDRRKRRAAKGLKATAGSTQARCFVASRSICHHFILVKTSTLILGRNLKPAKRKKARFNER